MPDGSVCCFPANYKTTLAGGLKFGRNRIRTYVGRSPTVLQTVAFDRSAILPYKLLKQLGVYIITKKNIHVIFSSLFRRKMLQ